MGNGVENSPSGPEMRKNVLQVVTARFLSGSSFDSVVSHILMPISDEWNGTRILHRDASRVVKPM
jgi:hypothetical protein